MDIRKVLDDYNINGELLNIESNKSGNINNTYIVTYLDDGIIRKYLVQKINTTVFHEPYKLMKNIDNVTRYLKNKLDSIGDTEHKALEIVKTNEDMLVSVIVNSNLEKVYYRVYNYLDNSVSYDYSIDRDIVYNTGRAFGNFNKLLNDYPIDTLEETIKDFHNTKVRYNKFIYDINIDPQDRLKNVYKEVVEIVKRQNICSLIVDALDKKIIPYRVTHNDTKVNNVMMNKDTNDYMAVIDLDTIMPGSLLYDYGDGIRSTSSKTSEDEKDLSKVGIDLDLFRSYTDGYMSEMADYLTEEEVSLMAESIRIITLELSIRFLNDYINGDTYFKINYKDHNLDRAKCQLALVKDIENKLSYMQNYINITYKKYKSRDKVMKKVK